MRKYLRAVAFAIAMLYAAIGAHAQGGDIGSTSSPVANNQGRPIPGANIAICQPLATTAASVTSNLAVLTMASNPITAGFAAGMQIQVAGFTGGDTYFNGGMLTNGQITSGFTILSVTSTTITYALTHANASAATNGTALQEGNATTPCAGLSTITSDPALMTTITQPLVSDALGNWNAFAAPGVYYTQFYGAGLSTVVKQVAIACVPLNVANCGALLGTANNWTALQTFSGGAAVTGGTFSGTIAGTPTLSGLWTFNAGLTSAGPNTLNGGGTTAGSWTDSGTWTHSGIHTFTTANSILPGAPGGTILGSLAVPHGSIILGYVANQTTTFDTNSTGARLAHFPDATGTVSFAAVQYCGLTSGASQPCANTVEKLPIIVYGEVTLNTATTQSITSLPFTAGADYSCTGSDLTTTTGTVFFNTYAAASVTIGENGGVNTDHLRYVCVGF